LVRSYDALKKKKAKTIDEKRRHIEKVEDQQCLGETKEYTKFGSKAMYLLPQLRGCAAVLFARTAGPST
jgi:hypothetical protein